MDITGFYEYWFYYTTLLIVGLGSIVFFILGFFAKEADEKEEFEKLQNAIFSLSGSQSVIIVAIFCIALRIFQNLNGIGLFPIVLFLIICYITALFALINLISFFVGLILKLIISSIGILFIHLIRMK